MSAARASAAWSSVSPAYRGRCLTRLRFPTRPSPRKWHRMPRNWREWMTPSARFRTGTIPSAQTACFRRGSGSCCPLPAAAANPAVLLLDEITANLDAETETRVLEALRRASEGRTVMSISHRIYENLGGRTVELKPCEVQSCKIPAVDSAADCSVKSV